MTGRKNNPLLWFGLGLGIGAVAASLHKVLTVSNELLKGDQVEALLHPARGVGFTEQRADEVYTVTHTVEDGIERIHYLPHKRRFETPILMQHGMWHGAWCWQTWQALLAEWGWESIAISQPGHGRSPVQRPLMFCTLEYYLSFLKAEVERLPRKPVLMGHSMGGALTQWYLKYVGDDLPAAVLVAPWNAFNSVTDSVFMALQADPVGMLLNLFNSTANASMRTPRSAARQLLSPRSIYTPEEFHARLGGESGLVLFEHCPPRWTPPVNVQTPLLLLAGEKDAVVGLEGLRRSAAYYGATFVVVPEGAHNLMHEYNYRETAETIHHWLVERVA